MNVHIFFNFALPSELLCKRTARFFAQIERSLWIARFLLYCSLIDLFVLYFLCCCHSWWIKDCQNMVKLRA